MKMTKFMASLFATSLLTLAACSNDENDPIGGSGNTEEGIRTWARLDIKVGGPVTRATVPDGTDDSKINKVNVYVFDDAGKFETKTTVNTPTTDHNTVHSATLSLTSGQKKVYVLANMDDGWMPAPVPATQTEFEAVVHELCTTPGRQSPAVTRVGDQFSDLTGGADGGKGFLLSNALTKVDFKLNPGVSKEQAAQSSYNDATEMEKYNHLQITLFRAAAKIQVSYADENALNVKSKTDNNKIIAKLDPNSLQFAIRNIPKSTYMFLHNRDNALLTPHYAATNLNSQESDFAVIFDETEPINNVVKAVGSNPVSVYVPENANQTPMVGNTTYAIVKATLRPVANVMINAIEASTDKNPQNYTIKLDDTDYSATGAPVPPFFTAENKIFTLPKGSENMSVTDREEYGYSLLLKNYLITNKKYEYLEASGNKPVEEGDVDNKFEIYYTCDAATPTVRGIYRFAQITKHFRKKGGTTYDAEPVTEIRYLQYDKGTVYYRVNIEDNADNKTDSHNLFYSVMRNRFYKVDIKTVNAIGTPSEGGSSTIDPSEPVNSKTYMQAHITVEPWMVVEQNANLGI